MAEDARTTPPRERVLSQVQDTAGAYAQAVANMNAGIDAALARLGEGREVMAVWVDLSDRIVQAMQRVPPHFATDFLSNLVAAVQSCMARSEVDPGSYPDLVPGVQLQLSLLGQGRSELEAWTILSNRTCNAVHGLSAHVAVRELADLAAAGQVLIAQQRRVRTDG